MENAKPAAHSYRKTGKLFEKGHPALPGGGRTKGSPNKSTVQVREICRALTFGNQQVLDRIRRECEEGTVNPRVFIELLHYAYGKPPDRLIVEGEERSPLVFLTQRPIGSYDPLAQTKPIGAESPNPPLEASDAEASDGLHIVEDI
jgi:hypothetical protein